MSSSRSCERSSTADIVVVGSMGDAHVADVRSRLRRPCLVVDSQALTAMDWVVTPSGAVIDNTAIRQGSRGWIRRFAPPGWSDNVVVGSLAAAKHAAIFAVLGAVMRGQNVEWVASLDALTRAESKLEQYAAADRLRIPRPDTIVTSDADRIRERFGDRCVLKPLSVGHFTDEQGIEQTAYAAEVFTSDVTPDMLRGTPVLAQSRLNARRHLRVVTVADESWCCALYAADRPVDWRRDESAHAAFARADGLDDVAARAKALAREMDVAFSSQDWIETDDDCVFLDLNPSGQWLFLPERVALDISERLAAWLEGDR